MYTVGMKREIEIKHRLPKAEKKERSIHSHDYVLEVELFAGRLNDKGYLLDLNELKERIEKIKDKFGGDLLNDLPEFEGVQPTVENFSRVIFEEISNRIDSEKIESIKVKIWEEEDAYASYSGRIKD